MRIYPEGSVQAQENYIREKAREGFAIGYARNADPEVATEVPIEVYARFNPVAEEHEPEDTNAWIGRL